MRFVFALGVADMNAGDIDAEARDFDDLLQFRFADSYRNNTRKVQIGCFFLINHTVPRVAAQLMHTFDYLHRWATTCATAFAPPRYVLLIDDDYWLNVHNLAEHVHALDVVANRGAWLIIASQCE